MVPREVGSSQYNVGLGTRLTPIVTSIMVNAKEVYLPLSRSLSFEQVFSPLAGYFFEEAFSQRHICCFYALYPSILTHLTKQMCTLVYICYTLVNIGRRLAYIYRLQARLHLCTLVNICCTRASHTDVF
jgi:hypothetical protein